ncbi:MAG: T9SS type A sorting domain-containing protein [Flavobacteriales bacterium]|nr:MAG: T9SS type A sorting domain-containing protein [Flavobacteriales bacterium]
MRNVALMIGIASLVPGVAIAQVPDPDFGNDGFALIDLSGADEQFFDMVVQPDGKVVAAGSAYGFSNGMGFVCRFTLNGNPDPTFSADGAYTSQFVDSDTEYRGVAMQPDGKVVLVGTITSWDFGTTTAFVLRLNPNGSPDGSFGTGGYAYMSGPAFTEFREVAIDDDGSVVAVGMHYDQGGSQLGDVLVARFTSAGDPDAAFATDGVFLWDNSSYWDEVNAVRIATDGSIVCAAGTSPSMLGLEPVLLRLTAAGTLDPAFGAGTGYVELGGLGPAMDLDVMGDGRVVTVISRRDAGGARFMEVMRTQPEGSIDVAFGNNGGVVVSGITGDCSWAGGLNVDDSGHILVGGSVQTSCAGIGNFILAALQPDGTTNNFFGTDGYYRTTNAGVNVFYAPDAPALAVADGRVLLASVVSDGANDGVVFAVNGIALSIGPDIHPEVLVLYPQPADALFWFPADEGAVIDHIEIHDVVGRRVIVLENHLAQSPIGLHQLPSGSYLVQAQMGHKRYAGKLIVQL